MKFSVTAKASMPCVEDEFTINNKKADVSDFGLIYNHGVGNTNCCESMRLSLANQATRFFVSIALLLTNTTKSVLISLINLLSVVAIFVLGSEN